MSRILELTIAARKYDKLWKKIFSIFPNIIQTIKREIESIDVGEKSHAKR
ncbi:hypothetical protein HY745_05555 [Candidatus Desantisbacteria bacterium]|nr:hypothetical protein [Candidatus Desantisbacteria bacterium]